MTQNKFEIFNALFPLAVVSGPLLVVATVIFPVIAGILILSQPAADTRKATRRVHRQVSPPALIEEHVVRTPVSSTPPPTTRKVSPLMKYESPLDPRNARRIEPGHPEWPAQLDALSPESRPNHMWVLGEGRLNELVDRSIVVTGAGAATSYGETIASDLACGLVAQGHTVLSGGGFGIAQAALHGACAYPQTVGPAIVVQAGGLDRLFTAHRALLESVIARGGLIISEHDPGVFPNRTHILSRNRLLAALCTAMVIVESHRRSTTTTDLVDWARLMKRPTMAFPGPITSAASVGNHRLIRAGQATLVTSSDDVIQELHAAAPTPETSSSKHAIISAGTVLEPDDVKQGMRLTLSLVDTPPGFVQHASYTFVVDSEPREVHGEIYVDYRGGSPRANFSIDSPWVITLAEDFAINTEGVVQA